MRLIDADALEQAYDDKYTLGDCGRRERDDVVYALRDAPTVEPVSPWHRVDEPPKKAGEYIVAYHPCWWDDVKTQVTKVSIDSFRGKASWAKRKTQRVTHWMDKPEPPKEDA